MSNAWRQAEMALYGWTRLQEKRCDEGEWVQLHALITEAIDAAVAEARREERERLAEWVHVCTLEACCIENGLHALSGPPEVP